MSEPIKPVSNVAFWREQILRAIATGKELHTVIYEVDYADWMEINDNTRSVLADLLQAGDRLLDAGCGYGVVSELVPEGVEYVGLDISPDLLDIGRIRYPDANLQQIDLLTDSLEFLDKHFKLALCRSMRKMALNNLGQSEWDLMRTQLHRVAESVVCVEYEGSITWECDKL